MLARGHLWPTARATLLPYTTLFRSPMCRERLAIRAESRLGRHSLARATHRNLGNFSPRQLDARKGTPLAYSQSHTLALHDALPISYVPGKISHKSRVPSGTTLSGPRNTSKLG